MTHPAKTASTAKTNYRKCPCGKTVHMQSGSVCPHCKLTAEQHQTKAAQRRNQAEQTRRETILKSWICTDCRTITPTRQVLTKGSILIEIILWCCFIVPGLIYSIWRHTTRAPGCKTCGGKTLQIKTPVGLQLFKLTRATAP